MEDIYGEGESLLHLTMAIKFTYSSLLIPVLMFGFFLLIQGEPSHTRDGLLENP